MGPNDDDAQEGTVVEVEARADEFVIGMSTVTPGVLLVVTWVALVYLLVYINRNDTQ